MKEVKNFIDWYLELTRRDIEDNISFPPASGLVKQLKAEEETLKAISDNFDFIYGMYQG